MPSWKSESESRKPWDLDLVAIYWSDASSGSGWMTIKEWEDPDLECVSVGYVYKETEEHITLIYTKAVNISPSAADTDYNGYITIPKPWIGSIHPVKILQRER